VSRRRPDSAIESVTWLLVTCAVPAASIHDNAPLVKTGATPASSKVTVLLRAWSDGDENALEKLLPLVETELRRLARIYMARERRGHTLQATALVNEAYVRLVDTKGLRWQDRAHFLGISARLMRRVLVDHARGRGYQKRGGTPRENIGSDRRLTCFLACKTRRLTCRAARRSRRHPTSDTRSLLQEGTETRSRKARRRRRRTARRQTR
jgi:ECF sigma factor